MKFITGIIKDCINNKHPVKLRNGNKAYELCYDYLTRGRMEN